MIIGSVASGKTTLAKKISKENNIKYYEIDSVVHDDYVKRKRSNKEQQEILNQIIKNDSWILEGTLRKNLHNLLDEANKIIYINIPLKKRKKRILKRFIKQKIGIEKCNYKPTIKMLKKMYQWTDEFEVNKNELETKLKKYKQKLEELDTEQKTKKYNLSDQSRTDAISC